MNRLRAVPERPLLSPWHRFVDESDGIVVEYGGKVVAFEGRAARALLPSLLPLLDGTATVDELAAAFGAEARPAIEKAVALLAEHGLLTEGPPLEAALPESTAAAALFHAAVDGPVPSPAAALATLENGRIVVLGDSGAAGEICRTFRLSGLNGVVRADWRDAVSHETLVIVAPGPGELTRLPDWNEAAIAASLPWLQVLPFNGTFAAVGPLFVPGETCCYECYRRRRAANVDYPDEFWSLERKATGGTPQAPSVSACVAGLAVLAATRWLLFGDPFAAGTMLALSLAGTPSLSSHVVYRVPRCPACTDALRAAPPLPWTEAS